MKNRVAEVNRELKRLGHAERLKAGRGYYYFTGGNASSWMTSSVYVFRATQMTVDEWIREFKLLKGDRSV